RSVVHPVGPLARLRGGVAGPRAVVRVGLRRPLAGHGLAVLGRVLAVARLAGDVARRRGGRVPGLAVPGLPVVRLPVTGLPGPTRLPVARLPVTLGAGRRRAGRAVRGLTVPVRVGAVPL